MGRRPVLAETPAVINSFTFSEPAQASPRTSPNLLGRLVLFYCSVRGHQYFYRLMGRKESLACWRCGDVTLS